MMSRRLVLINSLGPMGSSLVAGLLEKMGFTNVPLRKLGLTQYALKEIDLNSGIMQSKLEAHIQDHTKPGLYGGVSVVDRDSQTPKPLADINRVKDDLAAFKSKKFENLEDLYFESSRIYCKSVVYKKIKTSPDWKVELTVDIHRYNPSDIDNGYRESFSDIKMIHLTRPFGGWINSLASQAFCHHKLQNRVRFFPHKRHRDLVLYEDCMRNIPGMLLNFEELFTTPIEGLAKKLADYLNVPLPNIFWREEEYDMYGKIVPYDVAFKKFDDTQRFLSSGTMQFLRNNEDSARLSSPLFGAQAWARYMLDMRAWRSRNGF